MGEAYQMCPRTTPVRSLVDADKGAIGRGIRPQAPRIMRTCDRRGFPKLCRKSPTKTMVPPGRIELPTSALPRLSSTMSSGDRCDRYTAFSVSDRHVPVLRHGSCALCARSCFRSCHSFAQRGIASRMKASWIARNSGSLTTSWPSFRR